MGVALCRERACGGARSSTPSTSWTSSCAAQLMKMLKWHIGTRTGFQVNPGKFGKYYEQYLEPDLWDLLLKTYADADYDHTWGALLATGDLFRRAATGVAQHFGFEYPREDDERVTAHLHHVRALPRDARRCTDAKKRYRAHKLEESCFWESLITPSTGRTNAGRRTRGSCPRRASPASAWASSRGTGWSRSTVSSSSAGWRRRSTCSAAMASIRSSARPRPPIRHGSTQSSLTSTR